MNGKELVHCAKERPNVVMGDLKQSVFFLWWCAEALWARNASASVSCALVQKYFEIGNIIPKAHSTQTGARTLDNSMM